MAEYANATFESRRPARTKLWAALTLAVFAAIAAGLYTAFWFDAAERLKTGIVEWTAQQRAAGNFVVLNDLKITGFPLAFTLTADQAVVGRTDKRTYSWRAEAFRARAWVWSPRTMTVNAPDNGLTFSARGNSRNVEMNAASLAMTVHLDDANWPRTVTARFERPVLRILGVRDEIAASTLTLNAAAAPDGQGSLALDAIDITSGQALLQRLGGTIDRITAAADLKGAWTTGPLERQLDAWRLGGGTLEMRDTRLDWGGLTVDAAGTFSLDEELRPLGAMTATFLGLSDFIDRLQAAEIIRPRDAAAAKVSINLLGERTEAGRIRIPVTAQFGRLSVGPIALGDLLPVPELLDIPNLQ